MCFYFPKQNKIFDFVSASKNIFFLFPQLNIISLGLFPQVKLLLLAETNTKNMFTCGNKTESISTCGNKIKDFLLLEKATKYFFCLGKQSQKHFCLQKQSQRFSFACENKN